MSLQLAANHLAAQGRGPDTTLVHMGQGEVDALQGLARAAGGSLTTNPQTGLPEAGFLSSILPILAGAAGSFVGIPPWATMALVGGVTGAASGSLSKGLMAGLGAYGGSSLAGGLGAMGAGAGAATTTAGAALPAATTTATTAAGAALPAVTPAAEMAAAGATSFPVSTGSAITTDLASNAGSALTGNEGAFALKGATPLSYDTGVQSFGSLGKGAMPMGAGYDTGVAKALSATGATPASLAATPAAATPAVAAAAPVDAAAAAQKANEAAFKAMSPMDRMSAMGRGATLENVGSWASANKGQALGLAAPFIANMMKQPKYDEEEDSDPGQQYTYQSNPTAPTPQPDPYGREQTYFKPRYVNAAAGGAMRGLPSAESSLGSYSAGGRGRLLRGPGDGVSDSIPAVIGNKQPARLADGEFVIPARIVSELGNGSTEAGAKQLYAMMDRIQRARGKTTGKKQVAKNTKAYKLMPA